MANKAGDIVHYDDCKFANGGPCATCSEAIELETLVIQARNNLEDLLSRQQELHTRINNAHDYITERIPPEVSSIIFLFSLSENVPRSFLDINSQHEETITTPLTLGAVCRSWRRIAWASQRLWTTISIPLKPSADFGFLKIAGDWLGRAGQHPLSLRVYAPQATFGDAYSTAALRDRLKDFIGPYLPRCHRLEFSCPTSLLPSLTANTPLLQEISIVSDVPAGVTPTLITLDMTRSKVKAIRLALTGYNIDSLSFPYKLVNKFEGIVTLDQYLRTLWLCDSLEECRILGLKEDPNDHQPPVNPGAQAVQRTLKRLTLHSKCYQSTALLGAVNLPNLTHLTGHDLKPSAIRRFVLRSMCNLQHLSLKTLCCEGADLCEMLRSMPSLKELYIREDDFNQYHVDVLFKELGENAVKQHNQLTPPFLPNLSVLKIRFCQETGFPWVPAVASFGSLKNLQDPERRPIKDFQIVYDWRMGAFGNEKWNFGDPMPSPTLVLSWEVTRRFMEIAESGVNVRLYDVYAKEDILRMSMEHHRIPVPAWYKPQDGTGLSNLERNSEELSDASSTDEDTDSDESEDDGGSEVEWDSGDESDESSVHSDILDLTYDPDIDLPPDVTGSTMDLV